MLKTERLGFLILVSLLVMTSLACFNLMVQADAETWDWKDEFTDKNSRWNWNYNKGTGTKNLITKDGLSVVKLEISDASTRTQLSDDALGGLIVTYASDKTIIVESKMQSSFNPTAPSVGTIGIGLWNSVDRMCWFIGCCPGSDADWLGFRAMAGVGGTFYVNKLVDIDLTQWHTYRIEISPSGIIFKIYGAVVASTSTVLPVGDWELIIWNDNGSVQNWAQDGYYDAPYAEAMYLDYVAYSYNDSQIPEFPSWMVPVLFFAAATSTLGLVNRRRRKSQAKNNNKPSQTDPLLNSNSFRE